MAAMGWWEKSRIHQALKRLIAGPGIEVDSTTPSAPVVSAKISTDPSNALSFGTDDGLFATGGGGTVTSVGMSVPSFLSVSGSPVTTSGTLAVTYSGTALPIANGGTAATTAAGARANLGAGTGDGSVTSVGVSGANGIGVSGSPVTTSGVIALSLGAITPTSVSTGALTASGAISLPAGSITRANLVNGGACSVVGRSANSAGVVADISMPTNDRLIGRVSDVVGSTQLTAGMVPNDLISDGMLRESVGLSVIGRAAATTGNPSDIVSTGARTFMASNSANTVVTFRDIESADFPTGNWIGANSGTGYATATTTLAADSTWYDTGASVSLTAGTYLVTSFANGFCRSTAAGGITTRLYNVTDAAAVPNSECLIHGNVLSCREDGSGTLSMIVTVAGTKTIRMEAERLAGGTYVTSPTVSSGTKGRSGVTYVRIY